MMNRKFELLLRAVLRKTEDHLLSWSETPDENAFKALFERGALTIDRVSVENEDGERVPWIIVDLLNERGRSAESYSADPQDPYYELLRNLWTAAQRSARKSEELLDTLLHELN